MNFEQMAKIVHELVQRQSNGETETLKAGTLPGMTLREQEAVADGFSKLRLSGDSIAIEIGPNAQWA